MNSKRGVISFESEGVPYTARLSTNAMVKYQDDTGENILDAFKKLQGGSPDLKRLRDIFWCIVQGDLSKAEIGDLMDDLTVNEVGRIIAETTTAAFPDSAGGEGGKPKPGKKSPPAT